MSPEKTLSGIDPRLGYKPAIEFIADPRYEQTLIEIRARGQQLISPIWALSRLAEVRFTPAGRSVVGEKLKASEDAETIGFVQTPRGLRFRAGSIDSLILAIERIFTDTDTINALTRKSKREADAGLKPYKEWFRSTLSTK